MADQPILVSAAVVGRRLGLGVPTADQVARITDAIVDAQDAVEDFLNRPLFPTVVVLEKQSPRYGQPVESYKAWDYESYDDDVNVANVEETGPDEYTVTLTIGLDGPNTRAIVRYVTWHAVESLRLDPASGMGARAVTSVSAEGQSISYESAKRAPGEAGAQPTLDSLRKFRRNAIFKRNRPPRPPWPFDSAPVGWDPS